jgi:hypothetical protein
MLARLSGQGPAHPPAEKSRREDINAEIAESAEKKVLRVFLCDLCVICFVKKVIGPSS